MALSVKSYLNFEGENPEIRRFSIPQDVSASYEYLVEKIRQVYPSLLRKKFTLFWRDEENELVALSSDEELVMALGCFSDGNFKIYIKETSDSTDGIGGKPSEKHIGVVCDVCDVEIVGTRFKCLACPDYDLCSGCEGKGFHPDHEMLRIRTPKRNPWEGFCHMFFGPRGHHRRGGHHRGRGHPTRGSRGGRPNCCPPFSPQFPGADPPCGPGPFPGPPPPCGSWQSSGGPWQFSGGPWGFSGGAWTNSSQNCSQKPSEDKQSDRSEQGQSQSSTGQQEMPNLQEIFSHVSEMARQFVNPDQFATWGFDGSQSGSEPKDVPINKEEEAKGAEKKDESEDTPMPSEPFVVVRDEKEGHAESSASDSQQNVGQRRKEEEEFQRRLDEAIKQMESMGFNNENGWLTQLLIAKDFDIGRVIDTLQLKQN